MLLGPFGDHAARALRTVGSVMTDPGFPQHLPAKTAGPVFALPVVLGKELAFAIAEGVGRRGRPMIGLPETRYLSMYCICSSGRLRKRVKRIMRSALCSASRPGMLCLTGVDGTVLQINGEQDGTFATVMPSEDLAELRQRFFGAVIIITAYKQDSADLI